MIGKEAWGNGERGLGSEGLTSHLNNISSHYPPAGKRLRITLPGVLAAEKRLSEGPVW